LTRRVPTWHAFKRTGKKALFFCPTGTLAPPAVLAINPKAAGSLLSFSVGAGCTSQDRKVFMSRT
jgi:hypothetical protein